MTARYRSKNSYRPNRFGSVHLPADHLAQKAIVARVHTAIGTRFSVELRSLLAQCSLLALCDRRFHGMWAP